MINSYVYHRCRKQNPEIGFFTYSLDQIKQFTVTIILKYAAEYSHNQYNAKEFMREMYEWIDRISPTKYV